MYYPSRSEFVKLSGQGNLIPVYTEFLADTETPVSAYLKLADGEYSYLLESVEGEEKIARYSFLSSSPSLILKIDNEDPLPKIKELMKKYKFVNVDGSPRFCGGLVGFIGYKTVRFFEDIPIADNDDLRLPESIFLLSDTLVVFDHIRHKIQIVSNADLTRYSLTRAYKEAVRKIETIIDRLSKPLAPHSIEYSLNTGRRNRTIHSNMTINEFKKMVIKAKRYIKDGDIIQVVLSQRFETPIKSKAFDIYRALRTMNPSPYMYYLSLRDFSIVGSSPEMLVRCHDGVVRTRPIAGTRPRGKSERQDMAFASNLIEDCKERAEHLMLVDLGRNDLGKVCNKGSVKVKDFMSIERYSHVMHLVTDVEGTLSKDKDIYDVFRATFPAGTVTGAPKVRAMEIIAELEKTQRGPYAGCVGYFSFSGNMDTCITIRTIVIKDGVAYVQAGAGIVADSEPKREYQETVNKVTGCFKAIEIAEKFL